MKSFYIVFIFQLCLHDTWSRVKLIKIKNLTQELQHYNAPLLPRKIFANKLIRYKATLRLRKTIQRIIGGQPTDIKYHPYVAFLLQIHFPLGLDFRGGAVIIGEYWAVTAAHCFKYIDDPYIKQELAFVCGNTSNWKLGGNEHHIIKIFKHERYNATELDYDIGLVKVKEPFNGKYEKSIKWASRNYKYVDNAHAIVLGWGSTRPIHDTSIQDNLRFVAVRLVNQEECKKRYSREDTVVTSRMFCAFDKGKDACSFDSGGPLIRNKVLIGIVSWGPHSQCAHSTLPGVYTRVSIFDEPIRKKIKTK
ncbi:hypothetical protein ILUMI_04362 [Ignelater luminosus]|uniref:trypsin n=1 Tax=Ignelater luminosus TaxID=2038154 RepID=A0A8K0DEL0_IGNLU|nr:hypothetical protein ILUMI_04362 [Ignelater luminosus]